MTFPLTTTLSNIFACHPCPDGWRVGLAAAGKTAPDDTPICYEQILDKVGLDKALWCARAEPQNRRHWRLFAVWCARRVQHLMKDQRSIDALDVAERHAGGRATNRDLVAAAAAAFDALEAAHADADALADTDALAARAATASAYAFGVDPSAAAAAFAACAARAATASAYATARAARADAEGAVQAAAFRQLVTTGTLPP
jgi:hypothetical protein